MIVKEKNSGVKVVHGCFTSVSDSIGMFTCKYACALQQLTVLYTHYENIVYSIILYLFHASKVQVEPLVVHSVVQHNQVYPAVSSGLLYYVCSYRRYKQCMPITTVEPLYSGHPWGTTLWPLYRGGCSSGVLLLWKSSYVAKFIPDQI